MHVADHARDLPCVVRREQVQHASAEGLTVRNVAAHERFVDQHDAGSAPGVRPAQVTAAKKGNTHRLRISGRDPYRLRLRCLTGRQLFAALEAKAQCGLRSRIERNIRQQRAAARTGHAGNPLQELLGESRDAIVSVLRFWQVEVGHQHSLRRCQSRAHIEQHSQRANHQPGACGQHQGERHLRHDQRRAGACARAAAARSVPEHVHQAGLGDLKGRREARQETRQHGNEQREPERCSIEMHFIDARRSLGRKGKQRIEAPGSEHHPESAAGHSH